ncbi:hypothetical protein [Undibacterium sp. Tian12W]|uniref:hypothetical protein n=1 Tax=Undibacterium sp. Tian12W TaxID=3413054 RepID=UPI003BF10185
MPRSFKHQAFKTQKPQTLDIIRKLHDMSGLQGPELESPLERWSEKTLDKLMKAGFILFGLIIIFALWHFISPLNEHAVIFALVLGAAAIILPTCALMITIYSAIVTIKNLKKKSLENFILGIEADQKHVSELYAYSKKDLEHAQRIIQLKITRIKNKISLVIGSPEKIAFISLAAIGCTLIKEFSSKTPPVKLPEISLVSAPLYEFIFCAAFMLSLLAFVVVYLSRGMREYVYQSEILDLAIALKKENEAA